MTGIALPRGYYAVQNDFENASKDTFVYKGVTYAVTEGENLFPTLSEAGKAAAEIPEECLAGLEGMELTTPVLLFSEGCHTIDRFAFSRSLTLLGQNAGIDPSLPQKDASAVPEINPDREQNESILYGSYWFGSYQVGDPSVEKIVVDGFSVKGARFNDLRGGGGPYSVSFKNMIHQRYDGHTLYTFAPRKGDQTVEREVLFEKIRVVDFDDCDYGAYFINICATKAVFDGVIHAQTNQTFGICDSARGWSGYCGQPSEYVVRNSLFCDNCGYGGFMTAIGKDSDAEIRFSFENTSFINASQENTPPLSPRLSNNCTLSLRDCRFLDTRKNSGAAVSVLGSTVNTTVENTPPLSPR